MAQAQVTFTVHQFSKDYYAKLYIADTAQVFSQGWVAVYNNKTQKQLIKVIADELTFTLHKDKLLANIQELPYGEQSQVIYEDFNFDGRKDFALMDGQNSCYHGPSFKIYLATATGFKNSVAFTRLAQEYCGMFIVNAKEKMLHTMTKSGCCWHQYSDFIIKNNEPIAQKIVEEQVDASGLVYNYLEKNRINGKLTEKHYSVFDPADFAKNILFQFQLNNKKKMYILKSDGERLHYIFTDKEGIVELQYNGNFHYWGKQNMLWFTNKNITYKIFPTQILVIKNNKEFVMQAVGKTISGSLSVLQNQKINNVQKDNNAQ